MADSIKLLNACVLETPEKMVHAMTIEIRGDKHSANLIVVSEGKMNRNGVFVTDDHALCEYVESPNKLNAIIKGWRKLTSERVPQ